MGPARRAGARSAGAPVDRSWRVGRRDTAHGRRAGVQPSQWCCSAGLCPLRLPICLRSGSVALTWSRPR
eukprot:405658-Prymnesium_polylepis.1